MAGERGRVPTEQYVRDNDAEVVDGMQVTRVQQIDTPGELYLLRRCDYGTHITHLVSASLATASRLDAGGICNQSVQLE